MTRTSTTRKTMVLSLARTILQTLPRPRVQTTRHQPSQLHLLVVRKAVQPVLPRPLRTHLEARTWNLALVAHQLMAVETLLIAGQRMMLVREVRQVAKKSFSTMVLAGSSTVEIVIITAIGDKVVAIIDAIHTVREASEVMIGLVTTITDLEAKRVSSLKVVATEIVAMEAIMTMVGAAIIRSLTKTR